jgi:hypothetical protein
VQNRIDLIDETEFKQRYHQQCMMNWDLTLELLNIGIITHRHCWLMSLTVFHLDLTYGPGKNDADGDVIGYRPAVLKRSQLSVLSCPFLNGPSYLYNVASFKTVPAICTMLLKY